jgi:50S ribosomal protein L16 3-hydroxylase
VPDRRCGHTNPALLTDWLLPHDLDWFTANHLSAAPYAAPGAATSALPLLTWDTVESVLRSEAPLDVLTVSAGQVIDVPVPRSLAEVARLMRLGVSVVVRASERHDAGLGALAASFERTLPGEVHVQLYVTPGGTNSYGWHYDFEQVFIAQTAGVKDYYFRDNTLAREVVLGDRLDFTSFIREVSPVFSARLIAGDWLYLPPRWWHLVKCVDDSLSISVGVMPPEALERARRIPRGWSGRSRTDGGRTGG